MHALSVKMKSGYARNHTAKSIFLFAGNKNGISVQILVCHWLQSDFCYQKESTGSNLFSLIVFLGFSVFHKSQIGNMPTFFFHSPSNDIFDEKLWRNN